MASVEFGGGAEQDPIPIELRRRTSKSYSKYHMGRPQSASPPPHQLECDCAVWGSHYWGFCFDHCDVMAHCSFLCSRHVKRPGAPPRATTAGSASARESSFPVLCCGFVWS